MVRRLNSSMSWMVCLRPVVHLRSLDINYHGPSSKLVDEVDGPVSEFVHEIDSLSPNFGSLSTWTG